MFSVLMAFLLLFSLQLTSPQLLGGAVTSAAISSPDEGVLECPTWTVPTYHNTTNLSAGFTCECAGTVDAIVVCDPVTKSTYVHLSYCMSYLEDSNRTVFGGCFYNNYQIYSSSRYSQYLRARNLSTVLEATHAYYPVPRNKSDLDVSCDYLNRKGVHCGKCKDGFAPPLLSYDLRCVNCSGEHRVGNWFNLCARVIVPITLLYVFALVFRSSLLNPKLNGFILFSQCISSPPLVRQVVLLLGSEPESSTSIRKLAYAIISLYSWCNLDFFSLFLSPICDPDFDTFRVFVFNYVSIVYPLLLVFLTYLYIELRDRGKMCLSSVHQSCHHGFVLFRKKCNIRHSLIEVFTSVVLISYVRFLAISFDLLTFVKLFDIKNKEVGTLYWSYDASREISKKGVLPVIVPVLCLACGVVFLPILLLCGCSSRYLHWLFAKLSCNRCQFLPLQAFIDAFQGCYKDGTRPGTRNCRFVAALNLILRTCFYLFYIVVIGHHYHLITICLALLYAVFIAVLKPYKREHALQNTIDPLMMMCFCLLELGILGTIFFQTERRNWLTSATIFCVVVSVLPLTYIAALILHWLHGTVLVQRARKKIRRLRSFMGGNHDGNDEADETFNAWILGRGYGGTDHRVMTQNIK